MPTLKREHCVTDTTALLYDIAVTLEKILAALDPAEKTETQQPATAADSRKTAAQPNKKR